MGSQSLLVVTPDLMQNLHEFSILWVGSNIAMAVDRGRKMPTLDLWFSDMRLLGTGHLFTIRPILWILTVHRCVMTGRTVTYILRLVNCTHMFYVQCKAFIIITFCFGAHVFHFFPPDGGFTEEAYGACI